MEIRHFDEILAEHPLFKSFDAETIALFAGCAKNEHFRAGQRIYSEGAPADRFFIVTHGDVALEIATPEREPIITETVHTGELFGWSWMLPPYRHTNDAMALNDVRAISLDGACLRGKCETNPALGYTMFQNWVPHLITRLQSLRMQVLDLYGVKV
jgi:CRP/FNR family transcriptional regulator, cyclic AMP receptor protein